MEKFLLCRPRGGLNDSLVQIEKCWRYCEKWDRTLVIDTRTSGGFGLPFGLFFRPPKRTERVLLWASSNLLNRLNELSTFPHCVSGMLNDYEVDVEPTSQNICERKSKTQISFNFNTQYPESLLVHDQFGGGVLSVSCLSRLTLTEEFKRDVLSNLSVLQGAEYSAVVIRNTDYRTDYRAAFFELRPRVLGRRLLVCSDDRDVIDYAKSFFTESQVLTLPDFPGTNGRPIAEVLQESEDDVRYEFVVKSISDLVALSCAKKLYITRLINKKKSPYSGFARLSALLNRKKEIINSMFGR